jgi:2',3'-cyclic-nucleotide 2'-phosphodiesterase (5'-nucleotidase family)
MTRAVALLLMLLAASPAWAEPVVLTFLHFNDVYEYRPRDGQGGLPELGTRIAEEKARDPEAVVTFGGDLISPSLASNITKGAHMIEFMNGLGVAYAVPGNHEFDFGPAVFKERIKESSFAWVASNMPEAGGVFGGMAETALTTVHGVRVGILGVVTPDTAHLSSATGVAFTQPFEAARVAAAKLRAQGAQLVVALTHLDLADDRKLANTVPGIDVVLGGHDHDPYSLYEGKALVLKAGHDGEWLGVAQIGVERAADGAIKVRPLSWRFQPVAGAQPDARLARMADGVDALLDDALGQKVATLTTSMDSRGEVVRTGEAAIGNLYADALRAHFNADAALINGGGLRGRRQYPAGQELSRRDVLAEMPFGNAAVLLEVTGAQLRDALEWGLGGVEDRQGRFPQVSGLQVVWDPARPAGSRVHDVTVGGRKLDPKATYRLATIDYLAKGGDGYAALKSARQVVDASGGPLAANVVADYLAAKGSVAPRVEGRLKP